MGRKKDKPKRKNGRRISLSVVFGFIAAFAKPILYLLDRDFKKAFAKLVMNFSGSDPRDGSYKPERMIEGYLPIGLGAGISLLAGKFGLKRQISRNIPFITI